MKVQKITAKKLLLLAIVLILTGIACQYAGEIITSADATQRALPSATPTSDISIESKFREGDTVVVVGGQFGALVPLYTDPGSNDLGSQVMNNTTVIIDGVRIVDVETWYQIAGMAGEGWIREENLKTPDE